MKTRRTFAALTICLALLFGTTACVVLVPGKNGNQKGWTKNSNNPHHPNTTNPGHTKGKGKSKN